MALVHTTKGLIDEELLSYAYVEQSDDNSIGVAREWRIKDAADEIVRRDAWVTMKRGLETTAEKGL